MISVDEHPLLEARCFFTTWPRPLGELASPPEWLKLLAPGAAAPMSADDAVRGQVRDLLRHGGYKPTGRGKPASEYLLRACGEGVLGAINPAVDACNVVSLHSGLPISVVDVERAKAPFRISIVREPLAYVFNASGQSIDVEGLLCLFDADGPCANAVKDAQRTKTTPETRRTLSVVWGTKATPGRAEAAEQWYRALLAQLGAETSSS